MRVILVHILPDELDDLACLARERARLRNAAPDTRFVYSACDLCAPLLGRPPAIHPQRAAAWVAKLREAAAGGGGSCYVYRQSEVPALATACLLLGKSIPANRQSRGMEGLAQVTAAALCVTEALAWRAAACWLPIDAGPAAAVLSALEEAEPGLFGDAPRPRLCGRDGAPLEGYTAGAAAAIASRLPRLPIDGYHDGRVAAVLRKMRSGHAGADTAADPHRPSAVGDLLILHALLAHLPEVRWSVEPWGGRFGLLKDALLALAGALADPGDERRPEPFPALDADAARAAAAAFAGEWARRRGLA